MVTQNAWTSDGLSDTIKKILARQSDETKQASRGVAGESMSEPLPQYLSTPSEKVIANRNNATIVLGRDRPASRLSGYGGSGEGSAGSIDLVVGRMGARPMTKAKNGQQVYLDPNFRTDAARIVISQKTDIDNNFRLADGQVGNAERRSGIGIKADGVRIVAREGIKLVTKTDRRNSQGGKIDSMAGIDLIAGNDDDDLQPLVKGESLEACLKDVIKQMKKLAGIVDAILVSQMKMNTKVMTHFHYSPFYAMPTTPSPPVVAQGASTLADHISKGKASLYMYRLNLMFLENKYLLPAGKKYINSRFNNTN